MLEEALLDRKNNADPTGPGISRPELVASEMAHLVGFLAIARRHIVIAASVSLVAFFVSAGIQIWVALSGDLSGFAVASAPTAALGLAARHYSMSLDRARSESLEFLLFSAHSPTIRQRLARWRAEPPGPRRSAPTR